MKTASYPGDWGLLTDGTDTTNNGLIGFPYLPEVNV